MQEWGSSSEISSLGKTIYREHRANEQNSNLRFRNSVIWRDVLNPPIILRWPSSKKSSRSTWKQPGPRSVLCHVLRLGFIELFYLLLGTQVTPEDWTSESSSSSWDDGDSNENANLEALADHDCLLLAHSLVAAVPLDNF